jgi:hypothetical protein
MSACSVSTRIVISRPNDAPRFVLSAAAALAVVALAGCNPGCPAGTYLDGKFCRRLGGASGQAGGAGVSSTTPSSGSGGSGAPLVTSGASGGGGVAGMSAMQDAGMALSSPAAGRGGMVASPATAGAKATDGGKGGRDAGGKGNGGMSGGGSAGAGGDHSVACTGVCTADFPCTNPGPDYSCRGQFADWPMPDTTGSAKVSMTTFKSSVDGETLTDSVTGLMWQATIPLSAPGCSSGQAMQSGDQTNTSAGCTFSEAKVYCDALTVGGHDDWRMPTKIEMESLVDLRMIGLGSIRPDHSLALEGVFDLGSNSRAGTYWTSSPFLGPEGGAWILTAGSGRSVSSARYSSAYVRCVR